ncbi:hypothetical protein D9757_011338 [Collybiopsis confluens]|uniref:Uncharacterized protein n=1 Tax=Collybiopsis confluens TaxID=2823264 RepID=A0A8H5GGD5_9AGAR|nr:hypothetical protein D9757_011338 [Collybiopsis confluens]
MSILELSYLSADAISTSSADEHLQPAQQFRLLTEHDFLGWPDAIDYYWGLPKGTMNLFSELNLVSVRADIAQLLWAKRLALVPSLDLLPPMFQLLGDNLCCDIDSRRLCFEAFPVKEYDYRLFPLDDHGPLIFVRNSAGAVIHEEHFPYSNLPPLRLSLYPFVATTHAAGGLPARVPPEDPGYVLPIRGMFAILCSSVPKHFTCLHSSRGNRTVDLHDSSSDSESFLESESSSEPEPISGSCHTGHERRIHFWIQGTDDTPPDDPAVLNTSKKSQHPYSAEAS